MQIMENVLVGVLFFLACTLFLWAPVLVQYFGNLMLNM